MSRIFISYSHLGKGPEWKARLLKALAVFDRQHLLDVWEDGKIRVSSYWQDDIEKAMDEAQLAIVLLNKEALDSEFILTKELPRLRDRQREDKLPVFPVICEECNWRAHDWLRATQAPNNSNPLDQLSDAAQDQAFRELATAVAKELGRLAFAGSSTSQIPHSELKTYLDKFPLTRGPGQREEKLIGREQELALLDLAFPQPHTAIVSLVAWGGVGKTMLVQHWLQRLQREGWFGTQRVYVWSFYSQGTKEDRQASEDTFLAHALEWFGVQCEPTLSPWDKGRLLADAVARERTLLILDGIEPLQYPPGPMGGQLRAPGVQSLLKQLARKANAEVRTQKLEVSNSLCLVTTREPLTDLADFQRREGSPWGSVLRVDLGNLTEEAGAALLHHAGANRAGAAEIKPDDKELLAASREVDGHALTLNLLGRFLARAHGGDIRRRDLVKFEEADRKEQGGTTFKMLAAFENWFANEGDIEARSLTVLRLLGLFDRPADAGCLTALRQPPVIAGLTEPLFILRRDLVTEQSVEKSLSDKAWNDAIHFLVDFGLVVVQTDFVESERLLDCHPLIREFFAKKLQTESTLAKRCGHDRLSKHLIGGVDLLPTNFSDIEKLYLAVTHQCLAGEYQAAWKEVYQPRIRRHNAHYSVNKFGMFGSDLAALSGFFNLSWSVPHVTLDIRAHAELFYLIAIDLRSLGRGLDAIQLARRARDMVANSEHSDLAASTNRLICAIELSSGSIYQAVRTVELSLLMAEQSKSEYERMTAQTTAGAAYHQSGQIRRALRHLITAKKLLAEYREAFGDRWHELVRWHGFRHQDCALTLVETAAWKSQLCIASHDSRSLGSISRRCAALPAMPQPDHTSAGPLYEALQSLIIGRTLIYQTVVNSDETIRDSMQERAKHLLDQACQQFRSGGRVDYLPLVLLPKAWAHSLCSEWELAQADFEESEEIALRSGLRTFQADILLHRVRLFFRKKPYPWQSPQDDLAAAEKLINDCGYHRRDEELADAKRAILGE